MKRGIQKVAAAALLAGLGWAAVPSAQASKGKVAPGPWVFWQKYAAQFISPDGRVMDPDRNNMTTSEGQAYAMFFSLVANDADAFERLRKWSDSNLAQGSLGTHLPAWSWGQNGQTWGILDPNSASDADLWMAYTLLEAGQLWHKPEYRAQGTALLAQIAQLEVADLPGIGPALLPGPQGFHPDPHHWTLNLSYMPPALLNAAAASGSPGPWRAMAAGLPHLLEAASPNGFAMDWVTFTDDGTFAPATGPGNDPKPPGGSYDAIRVYLWVGMASGENPHRQELLSHFAPMAMLLRDHPVPPETVYPNGLPAGSGPLGFSAALTPLCWALNQPQLASEQQNRVQGGWNPGTGLLGTPARYYDQNLALFSSAWQEKRFRFAGNGALRVKWSQ